MPDLPERVSAAHRFPKSTAVCHQPKNATSADVAGLIQKVTETVQEKFGVTLEPEVIFLGDFEK